MADRVFNVLFLCTGNTARSIMAEVLLNAMGKGRFRGYSAGSYPKGQVHPLTLELIEKNHLPAGDLRSKSWDEFAKPDAPQMDFIFTVCDNAAGETCPAWPGHPMTAHWGVPDPAQAEGTIDDRRKAFFKAYSQLSNRVSLFVNLQLTSLDRAALQAGLNYIGKSQA